MKNKRGMTAIFILLLANICATAILGFTVYKLSCEQDPDGSTTQYVLYVGLNDKDTYEQVVSTEEAKKIIDDICIAYLDGYTIQEASGAWVDEKMHATHEQTIVCCFNDADEHIVYQIADEVIEQLNQNTVLIEKDQIETNFYGGSK